MKYKVKTLKQTITDKIETPWTGPDFYTKEVVKKQYTCELSEEEFKKCLFILSLTDKQYKKVKKKYKIEELELLWIKN